MTIAEPSTPSTPSSSSAGDVVPYPEEFARRYREAGYWRALTLAEELHETAERFADHEAVSSGTARLTYRELDRAADRFAVALRRLGLRPGDPVIFQLGNEVGTVVAYFGVLRAGLVPICSLAQHRSREIGYLIQHTGARLHLVEHRFRGHDLPGFAAEMAAGNPSIQAVIVFGGPGLEGQHSYEELVEAVDADEAAATVRTWRIDPESVGVFQLSGGTTGVPKLIPRLHCEYAYNARAWAETWGFGPGTVALQATPIMHNAGITCAVNAVLLSGGRLALAPRARLEDMTRIIAEEGVTDTLMGTGLATEISEHPGLAGMEFGSVRRMFFAPSIPSLARQAEELFGCPMVPLYGTGEGIFLTAAESEPEEARHGTCGRPLSPGDEVRLLRPGTEEEVPVGEIGELTARGPYTIRGYYRAAERNRTAFTSDGFYRTGDLARAHLIDGTLYYSHEGRITDNISRGGEKIHADELEALLVEHPAVAEVAVVGMPDRILGERVCAFVVLSAGAAAPTVADFAELLLAKGLAKFKLPERVEVIQDFPRTDVGKISKKDLRELIARRLQEEQAQTG
ncbi:(2,3-dihydroxybenzoyl)adenylate synthase [Actinomadura sp. 3N508]|uniref:(2,3-dihydroxybenzoyl)adenylate synthase n=1 Tax=Actinomadura sp. 3N508 TaxID=3375153 RepID=UPI003791DD8B